MYVRAALLAVLLLAASACASTRGGPAPPPGPVTTVTVTNNNWSDAAVYILRGGVRQRLGSVVSMTTRTLKLTPGTLAGGQGIRLMVDLIGSRETFTTEAILAQPGDRIVFEVQNHLAISSYAVWRDGPDGAERFARRDTVPGAWFRLMVHEDWDAWTFCATRPKSWFGNEVDPEKWEMIWAHEAEHRRHMAEFPNCAAFYAWKAGGREREVETEARAFCAGAWTDLRSGKFATLEAAIWQHAGWLMHYFGMTRGQAAVEIARVCGV